MNTTVMMVIASLFIVLGVVQCVWAVTFSKQVMKRRFKAHWADAIKEAYLFPFQWASDGKLACLSGWGSIGIGFIILFPDYFPWNLLVALLCFHGLARGQAHLLGFYHRFTSADFIIHRELFEFLEGKGRKR